MHRNAITHGQLMRESTDRIERALHGEDAREHMIAHRILETPGTFSSWELEHSALMRQVADVGSIRTQTLALRHAALRLIHAKALFEYLKRHEVRRAHRAAVLKHFYPTKLYSYALLQEHATFLRKAGSFICAHHLGGDYIQDPTFLDPMQQYETLYNEYFTLYCSTLGGDEESDAASERSLLPLLKHQLNEWRWFILNPRSAASSLRRESEIRRPLGDTQRMQTLKVPRSP